MAIDPTLRELVRQRAEDRCEYCHCHQDDLPFITFHIEHIVPKQHGGADDETNLCLACHWCNCFKGPNLATLVHTQLVPLFHPRKQNWNDHFKAEHEWIIGLTAIGQGTVDLLKINDDDRRELRRATSHVSDGF